MPLLFLYSLTTSENQRFSNFSGSIERTHGMKWFGIPFASYLSLEKKNFCVVASGNIFLLLKHRSSIGKWMENSNQVTLQRSKYLITAGYGKASKVTLSSLFYENKGLKSHLVSRCACNARVIVDASSNPPLLYTRYYSKRSFIQYVRKIF